MKARFRGWGRFCSLSQCSVVKPPQLILITEQFSILSYLVHRFPAVVLNYTLPYTLFLFWHAWCWSVCQSRESRKHARLRGFCPSWGRTGDYPRNTGCNTPSIHTRYGPFGKVYSMSLEWLRKPDKHGGNMQGVRTRGDLNNRPWTCEAIVLTTKPSCPPRLWSKNTIKPKLLRELLGQQVSTARKIPKSSLVCFLKSQCLEKRWVRWLSCSDSPRKFIPPPGDREESWCRSSLYLEGWRIESRPTRGLKWMYL